MELVNELSDLDSAISAGGIRPEALKESLEVLVLVLALFAPHIADELWEGLGHSEPTLRVAWPAYNPELAAEEELEIPVQVNGKLRSRIRVAVDTGEEEEFGDWRRPMRKWPSISMDAKSSRSSSSRKS